MKRVLMYMGGTLGYNGVSGVIMNIVRNLSEEYIFDVVVAEKGELDDEFLSYGGKIILYTDKKIRNRAINNIYRYTLKNLKLFYDCKKIIKENGPYDIIHSHAGLHNGVILKAGRKSGVLIRISHCHGKFIYTSQRNIKLKIELIYRKALKKSIEKNATHLLSCSYEAGKTMYLHPNKMQVLVNSVDVISYSTVQNNRSTGINLGIIGYFSPIKNQLFGMRILKKLLEQKIEAKLHLMGYVVDKQYYKQMIKYASVNSLQGNIIYYEKDFDKREFFSKINLLIMPSITEACPLVALEAQAANIKCLISESVPQDINIGLCEFISLEKLDIWVNKVANIMKLDLKRNDILLKKIDNEYYSSKISQIYNGEKKNETIN